MLHNMCIESNIPEPELEDSDEDIDFGLSIGGTQNITSNSRVNPDLVAGRRLQQQLIRKYFRVNN